MRGSGRLPAAVIAVDLYGQCADYDRIDAICERYGVPLIEDAAEALGATYGARQAGAFGECAAFSFNGNKIITTSGGGMLVSHRPRHRRAGAAPGDAGARAGAALRARRRRLQLPAEQPARGGRPRPAAPLLDAKVARRRAINEPTARRWRRCPASTFMPEAAVRPLELLADLRHDRPGAVRRRPRRRSGCTSRAANIESRPVWKPMHLQPVFRRVRGPRRRRCRALFETGLCLPSGSSLTAEDQQRVIVIARIECTAAVRGGRCARRDDGHDDFRSLVVRFAPAIWPSPCSSAWSSRRTSLAFCCASTAFRRPGR